MAFPTHSVKFVRASSQGASIVSGLQTGLGFTGDFTIEFWYKTPTTMSGAIFGTVLGKFPDGTNGTLFGLNGGSGGITDANLVIFKAGGETNVHINFLSTITATSTWYHIACVFTSASGKYELFLNGVSQGSDTSSLHSQNSNPATVTVGFDNQAGGAPAYYDNQLTLMRVWTATRTGAQLSANYCTELGSTANLSAEWTFDNVYTDNSGNSNTLTGVGSPTFALDVPSTCTVSKGNFLAFM